MIDKYEYKSGFFFLGQTSIALLNRKLYSRNRVHCRHGKSWLCHNVSFRIETTRDKVKGNNIEKRYKVIDIKHDTEPFRLIPTLLQQVDKGSNVWVHGPRNRSMDSNGFHKSVLNISMYIYKKGKMSKTWKPLGIFCGIWIWLEKVGSLTMTLYRTSCPQWLSLTFYKDGKGRILIDFKFAVCRWLNKS